MKKALIAAMCVFLAGEIGTALVLRAPTILGSLVQASQRFEDAAIAYNLRWSRKRLEFESRWARFDPKLGYRLEPGEAVIQDLEFKMPLRLNSRGLRDDQAALNAPEIIVLGDEIAMGWGVRENEATPQVLGAITGQKVLNAGLPSFGTVRQLRLLDELDTSHLKTLIILYRPAAALENIEFLQRGELIYTREEYGKQKAEYEASRRSYPGKYWVKLLIPALFGTMWDSSSRREPPNDRELETRAFIAALSRGTRKNLKTVRVVVLDINGSLNADALKSKVTLVTRKYRPRERFNLTRLFTARGHALTAKALAAELKP